MATVWKCSVISVFLSFVNVVACQEGFGKIFGDAEPCSNICQKTYAPHTYDKALHLSYCRRGCRLFSIIDFVHKNKDLNSTRECCASACKEAYRSVEEDQAACILGCNNQVQFAVKRHQEALQAPQSIHLVYPFMVVHTMYSNVVNRLHRTFTVNWRYYLQPDSGRVVIIRSEPSVYTERVNAPVAEYKTSNYLESNLASVDNSATPNLKSSQVHAFERGTNDANYVAGENQDWLSCISKKTGLPRMLLSFTLFLSAIVMIWLCFTTAATAPEHHIKAQKLSIYGDLDYLKVLKEKGISNISPQERTMYAPPLPVKIKVDQI